MGELEGAASRLRFVSNRRTWRSRPAGTAAVLAIVAVAGMFGACAPAPPLLTDPREILDRAVAHLRAATSVHAEASIDGRLPLGGILAGPAASAGALGMAGTHLAADLDLAGGQASVRFEIPALLGLTGEVRQVGAERYLRSSLTGHGWHRLTGVGLPIAMAPPATWIGQLTARLERPTTLPIRLDDSGCRSGTCYVLRVEADAADLRQLASAAPDVAGALAAANVAVDLRIDRSSLVLSEAVARVEPASGGSITLSAAFSGWNAPVRVEAPSPSEIVGGPLLP